VIKLYNSIAGRPPSSHNLVVWKITPLIASWIISSDNPLFKHHVLHSNSSVLELGCGISGIIGLVLGPLVQHYTLTDQEYVMKYLKQNLLNNMPNTSANGSRSRNPKARSPRAPATANVSSNITAQSLDWETDYVSSVVTELEEGSRSLDVIIACDCIYNDALIPPLVQTCVDVCLLRRTQTEDLEAEPTVCIIAQQLRSAEVFEAWLQAFHNAFRVWRVPDTDLTRELASNSGFVIHVGILR
jgi:hypothetical protein